jgi:hypothetical protein
MATGFYGVDPPPAACTQVEGWNSAVAVAWFPVNCVFASMIWTSFVSLNLLPVPMVTVLKNLTNLFTIAGDIVFFKKSYGFSVWLTLVLMTISALCGALTDISFTFRGYAWQIINCILTAAYSLVLRGTMDKVGQFCRPVQAPRAQRMCCAQELETSEAHLETEGPWFILFSCLFCVCV